MNIPNTALDIIKTLLIIDILIFVHELGHFIAAKKSGIKVLRFAIGFGPKLFGFKKGDTEYCILLLPFGGYVKMAGENPAEEPPEDKEGLYNLAPVSSRAAVAFSGPMMNIIFAVIAIAFAYMIGLPPRPGTEIGYVEPNSPAEKAGLIPGDKIVSINGYKTKNWDDVREHIAINPDKEIEIKLLRKESETVTINLIPQRAEGTEFGKIGISPPMFPAISQVKPNSEAELAGFRENDVITSANGKPINHVMELINEIEKSQKSKMPIDLIIMREGKAINMKLSLDFDESGQVKTLEGLAFGKVTRLNPISAFGAAIPETMETGGKIFQFLKRLIFRDVSAKYVAGPVGIIQVTMTAVKSGIAGILWFTGFLSINLGIINLLPIFITDGWVLLMLLIEKIRGKALSIKRQILIQQIGIGFFIILFLLVTYNDIIRIITKNF
ncbi:MAG: RIP metalloprotease RseP [Candidatus Poribacteria bacterium]